MSSDRPLWFGSESGDDGRAAAARLLRPDFRLTLGSITLGPLLARTLRGGLFAHVEDGEIAPRTAVEVAVGGAAPESTHDNLPQVFNRAPPSGLARVFRTGRAGQARWSIVERMHGWPLRVLLGRRGLAFTGRRLAALGAELADTLSSLERASDGTLVHGRLSVGHVLIDVAGRARLVGSPMSVLETDVLPDVVGLGATLVCAALAVAPDPRGLTPASTRALAAALDRPENSQRVPVGLRRLIQSLLALTPQSFLPSLQVLRDDFASRMEGLPMGAPDPAWGRALSDAVRGLPPTHRPTASDAEFVATTLALSLPSLVGSRKLRPPPPMLLEEPEAPAAAPRLHLPGAFDAPHRSPIHGAEPPTPRFS